MRVLVVEDHSDTRDVLVLLLRKAGHVIQTASCIAEAQCHCDPCSFDLLICDIGLPDGSGWDFMRYVQKTCPRPGIALTGYGAHADVQSSEESGYSAHLTKPISFDVLLRTVSAIQRESLAVGHTGSVVQTT